MEFKLDKGTGYMYCYSPKSCYANNAGKVMEHVYVMSKHLGRLLGSDECVHHEDRDRTNNSLSNLRLMTRKTHRVLHLMEDQGLEYKLTFCGQCNTAITTTMAVNKKFCSDDCSRLARRKFCISKEELEVLVWKYPTTEVAKMLGVSDVAISNRCKKLNVIKPPRGYWRKVATGYI